jgi:1-acyl-sn-glycerol-3-phosphate acyltransferase
MIAAFYAGVLRVITGARATWMAAEPSTQPTIYFANHTSNLDAAVLWASLPPAVRERTRPVAAQDYWDTNRIRRFMAVRIFNALLIERKNVTARTNPLPAIIAALDAGSSIIIFPEGGRSPGPEPGPFKSGIYHLARQRPNIPLTPVFLENFNRILPKGEFLPVPLLATVIVGAPIQLNADENKIDFLERARLAVWNLHRL